MATDFSEVLKAIDALVFSQTGKHLNEAEEHVLNGVWEGWSYSQMVEKSNNEYSLNYLKQDVGPNLWKLFSKLLGEKVGKSNLRAIVERLVLRNALRSKSIIELATENQALEPSFQKLENMVRQFSEACSETSKKLIDTPSGSLLLDSYVNILDKEFKFFSESILNIPKQRIRIDGDQRLELTMLLLKRLLDEDSAEVKKVYAISYGDTHRWWDRSLPRKFMRLNKALVKKGVYIKRIFILPDVEAEKNMEKIMKLHSFNKIDTYAAKSDDPDTRVSLLVCENLFTNCTNITKSGEEINGYISTNHFDIEENLEHFNEIETVLGENLRKVTVE